MTFKQKLLSDDTYDKFYLKTNKRKVCAIIPDCNVLYDSLGLFSSTEDFIIDVEYSLN